MTMTATANKGEKRTTTSEKQTTAMRNDQDKIVTIMVQLQKEPQKAATYKMNNQLNARSKKKRK